MKSRIIVSIVLIVFTAQISAAQSLWQLNVDVKNSDNSVSDNSNTLMKLEHAQLKERLYRNEKDILLQIPLPNGTLSTFELNHSAVMAPELAKKFPMIKTFTGVEVGNPMNSGRFDITPNGFHGMFSYDGKIVFVEPIDKSSVEKYRSYYREHNKGVSDSIHKTILRAPKHIPAAIRGIEALEKGSRKLSSLGAAISQIRTYRLAVSAVGEYTAYHGGTVESALSEIVTMVNRLNEVYLRDLSIKLELVADNDKLIFTNSATDPFNNNDNDGSLNTDVIDDAIGAENYDIGHVVGTGGGGLAVVGAVCFEGYKGDGVTGSPNPVNDAFYIDYVAHEIGHQFGAYHTFNGTAGACDSGRDRVAAYEPGSGSTIMAYAGICGNQNLQNHSDPYFSVKSLEQIDDFVTSSIRSSCGAIESEENNVPEVNGGSDYSIPAHTPFELTGTATDADGDSLTYSWEQYDLGNASSSAAEQIDDGSRPLFRVFEPTDTGTRVFPKLANVLAGSTSIGESYTTTNRDLNFKLIVRDNKGGVAIDDVLIQVVDKGEAFAVTAPVSSDSWTEQDATINWNVVGTDEAPISCTNVDIYLSSDGGSNFDTLLAENVANTGTANITLGTTQSDSARVKVKCVNNVFFAVNNGDFAIDVIGQVKVLTQQTIEITENASLTLTAEMFTFDQVVESIIVLPGGNYSISGNEVTPDTNFSGALVVNIAGVKGGEQGEVFAASVNVVALEVPVIASQSSLELDENTSLSLTVSHFNYSGITAEQIEIQAGENYSVSGRSITPTTDFTGTLTIGVVAIANGKRSDVFSATVTVNEVSTVPTPTPSTPDGDSSSSGGSSSAYLLLALGLVLTRRQIFPLK